MSEMVANRPQTIVYIDGFNFYYGAIKGTHYKWLNLEALCQRLLSGDNIVKIRYFTARVDARDDDPQLASRQGTYLRVLATMPLVEIHYGHFVTRPVRLPRAKPQPGESPTVEVLRTEEKGSDVNLATYLLLDACKNSCDTAVVFSNDSDLAQAFDVAQSEMGIRVGIFNPHLRRHRSRRLQELGCLFYRQVPKRALELSQLPDTVHDLIGPIRKPEGW